MSRTKGLDRRLSRLTGAALGLLALFGGIVVGPEGTSQEPEHVQLPVLAAWAQAVVDGVRVQAARTKVVSYEWPRDEFDGRAVRVVDERVFAVHQDAAEFRYLELTNTDMVVWGSVRTGWVRTSRSELVLGAGRLYALFLDAYQPTVTHVYSLTTGEGAAQASLGDVPNAHQHFLVSLGQKLPGDAPAYTGPVSVLDLGGEVRGAGALPPEYGAIGVTRSPCKVSDADFLHAVQVYERKEFPERVPIEVPTAGLLLMSITRDAEGTTGTRFIPTTADAFRLLPAIEPTKAELTAAAFVGDSVRDRLAVRRVAQYRRPPEELYTIELWDYRPDDTAQLIDLIAWYNGPDGMAFEYRVGPDGTVQETPTQTKTSFNFIWPLAPEPYGPNEIVYPHLDGIWKATLP